jgi:hypothetical protein
MTVLAGDMQTYWDEKAREDAYYFVDNRLEYGSRGQRNPAWMGSAVDLNNVRAAAAEVGLELEHVEGAGTQYCTVLLRRR